MIRPKSAALDPGSNNLPATAKSSTGEEARATPHLSGLVPGMARLAALRTRENGLKEAVTGTYETKAEAES